MEPENSLKCSGCRELVKEFEFKAHIRKCPKYDGLLLRNTRKLSEKLNPIEIKVQASSLSSSSPKSTSAARNWRTASRMRSPRKRSPTSPAPSWRSRPST